MDLKKQVFTHYYNKFNEFGDNWRGMDWQSHEACVMRNNAFLSAGVSGGKLLDYGCGSGLFLDYLKTVNNQIYSNSTIYVYDLNIAAVEKLVEKHPHVIVLKEIDINNKKYENFFNTVIANGVFTEKLNFSHSEFLEYFIKEVSFIHALTNGLTLFNVMSSNLDWCRLDLFHLGLDECFKIFCEWNVEIRLFTNYGLYEYIIGLKK